MGWMVGTLGHNQCPKFILNTIIKNNLKTKYKELDVFLKMKKNLRQELLQASLKETCKNKERKFKKKNKAKSVDRISQSGIWVGWWVHWGTICAPKGSMKVFECSAKKKPQDFKARHDLIHVIVGLSLKCFPTF